MLSAFGSQLKLLREHAGMERVELGELTRYSPWTIAAYEQGRRIAPPDFVRKVDEVLEAGGVLAAVVDELQAQRLPVFFNDFAEYEQSAVSICWYGNQVVPGLLQTKAYARTLLGANWPPLDEETIDERAAARLRRQTLLTRQPPAALCFIIGEAVLRSPVGGAHVLKEQLEQLLEYAELPNVQVQVMPFSQGAHVGLNGPMVVLETEDGATLGYVEPQGTGQIIADADEVGVFSQRYGILRSQALSTRDSVRFIERVMGEL